MDFKLFILGLLLILLGIYLIYYIGIYLMLYCGVMQVINNWGINTSLVIWGCIRVLFFKFGFIPGILIIIIGWYLAFSKDIHGYSYIK